MGNLRELAQQDLGMILEDRDNGFSWQIEVTNPAGLTVVDLSGFSNDVADLIDPDTGQAVSGRVASLAIRLQHLYDNNLAIPEAIADRASKPWVIKFDDINGFAHSFKVQQSNPDRALGIVTCVLEVYKDAP